MLFVLGLKSRISGTQTVHFHHNLVCRPDLAMIAV